MCKKMKTGGIEANRAHASCNFHYCTHYSCLILHFSKNHLFLLD